VPPVGDLDRVSRGRLVCADPGIGPPLPVKQPLERTGGLGVATLELREEREVLGGEPREATLRTGSPFHGAKTPPSFACEANRAPVARQCAPVSPGFNRTRPERNRGAEPNLALRRSVADIARIWAMRAVVVDAPGGPEELVVRDLPTPEARPGWTLVRVRAFGLNRAELMTRRGDSGDAVRFPRVLGIECVGTVEEAVDDEAPPLGTTVAAVMGGMGRAYDGGYAEYALLPTERLMPLETHLEWEALGALPETFLTARGSLDALGLGPGQTLLVRGAGSSVGLAALGLGAAAGLHVVGTTRDPAKAELLRDRGADDVLVDQGSIAGADVDGVLDLIGGPAVLDALRAVVPGGIVCATGLLGGSWIVERFRPLEDIPSGVKLTAFGSGVIDGPRWVEELQEIVDLVEEGRVHANLDRIFALDEISAAHAYMEANRATGKVVGIP
jgi:NADPH:quinone reductase-like Zn-dependent oxidoreductase